MVGIARAWLRPFNVVKLWLILMHVAQTTRKGDPPQAQCMYTLLYCHRWDRENNNNNKQKWKFKFSSCSPRTKGRRMPTAITTAFGTVAVTRFRTSTAEIGTKIIFRLKKTLWSHEFHLFLVFSYFFESRSRLITDEYRLPYTGFRVKVKRYWNVALAVTRPIV